ncbi:MAG: hypothetical protein ACYC4T_00315, partial [Melioribacteraceae bacterium]
MHILEENFRTPVKKYPASVKNSFLNSSVIFLYVFIAVFILMFLANASYGQNKITSPKEQLDFNVGDDYKLITYSQLVEYWKKLSAESPRIHLEVMGKTAEGRTQYMAIITSPKNFEKLSTYKEISRKLALADSITEEQAKEFSKTGK